MAQKTPQEVDKMDTKKEQTDSLIYTVETCGTGQEPKKITFDTEPAKTTLKDALGNLVEYLGPITQAARTAKEFMLTSMGISKEVIEAIGQIVNDYQLARRTYTQRELQKPEYNGKTFTEIEADGTDEAGETIPGSLYEKLMRAVDAAMAVAFFENVENNLQPFLQEELQKPEYKGRSIEDLRAEYLAAGERPGSLYEQAINAAEAAQNERLAQIEAQKQGRATRMQLKEKAQAANAIMTLQDGKLPMFSQKALWDAFAPGNICEMGTLDKSYIDKDTGLIGKYEFSPGELVDITQMAAPIQAFLLLNAIVANTVENVREEYVKSGEITFYVHGVLDAIAKDGRAAVDNDLLDNEQLTLDRKTAGVLYLENLFEPLIKYIGKLPNGSRYSVFNYIGYNAENDTMTIKTPYIYQLWQLSQDAYFDRQDRIAAARAENKKPAKKDYTPLEINEFFKQQAINEDPATLEIALYITNVMLSAGHGTPDRPKKTEMTFNKVIKNCPQLAYRLDEITHSEDEAKKRNPAAYIAKELRKFEKAYRLIMDPEKSDVLKRYTIVSFDPTKPAGKGKAFDPQTAVLIPPTKSRLNDKITIRWYDNPQG